MRYVCGACMMFRRSLWEYFHNQAPPFDAFHPGYFPAYGEEQDFCEQIFERGLMNVWVQYAYAHHYKEKTAEKVPDINRQRCSNLFSKRKHERAVILHRAQSSNYTHPGL